LNPPWADFGKLPVVFPAPRLVTTPRVAQHFVRLGISNLLYQPFESFMYLGWFQCNAIATLIDCDILKS
jgi:hypothetical protein